MKDISFVYMKINGKEDVLKFSPRRFSAKNYGERIGSSEDCISACVFPYFEDYSNEVQIFIEKRSSFRFRMEIY